MTHYRNDGKNNEKDEARTPVAVFKFLDDRYHFDVDVAANENNALCSSFFSRCNPIVYNPMELTRIPLAIDALNQDWEQWTRVGARTFFCNPPYSRGNVEDFCMKSYEESLKGAVVVMLLPMDSSTQWFHRYCSKAYKWIIFTPRVRFNHPDGTPFNGSPKFGSFACVFDEDGRKAYSSPLVEFVRWK